MSQLTSGNDAPDPEQLAELADEFAQHLRRGDAASIEEYAARFPTLANQIREVFPAIIAMEGTSDKISTTVAESIGTVIGRYKLLERLGEGGFGVVFMAEQQHPVHRKVALKVVKPGLDTRQVIARFEAEQQALARMDHENIAKVFDAGVTDAGRPYFVMELVYGIPITEYCDRNQLATRQRLALFVQICRAIQHAHTKGVIHRDVKPTNVLVTMQDGEPIPKVIDFGVAKAIGQALTDNTLFTNFAQMVGTPLYMSPEQAEMSAAEIDTRSDIYSLGVLLYELLTGTTPIDKDQLKQAAFDEVRRMIREQDPPRPSTRLSTMGAQIAGVSAQRKGDPKKLGQLLRGELDWIVMKALEKNRTRRYDSASGLSEDVERYLRNEQVMACPPTARYRIAKFVRRHKGAVAAATAIMCTLIVAVVVTSVALVGQARQRARAEVQERRASSQAAVAQAVSRFQSDMLSSADPERLLGDKVTVLQVVRSAVAELDAGKLNAEPLVEASLRATIGQSLRSLGRHAEAEPQLRKALELRRRSLPAIDLDLADSAFELAALLQDDGKWEEPPALFREALHIRRTLLPPAHAKIAKSLDSLGWLLWSQGNMREAEPLFLEAFDVLKRSLPPGHPHLAYGLSRLGSVCRWKGQLAEAEVLCREAMEIHRKALPAGHPEISAATCELANVLEDQGKLTEAEPLYREVLATYRKTLPAAHKEIARVLNRLGWTMRGQGHRAEAEQLFREGLAVAQQSMHAEHPNVAMAKNSLAWVLKDQQKYSEAELLFREALNDFRRSLQPDNPDIAVAMSSLASVLTDQRKYTEAEPLYRDALEFFRRVLPANHARIEGTLYGLGNLLLLQGKPAEAEPLLAELYQSLQQPGASQRYAPARLSAYGRCLIQLHRYQEAERPLRIAYDQARQQSPPNFRMMRELLTALAQVYDQTGRPEEATNCRSELNAIPTTTRPSTTTSPA